MDYGFTALNVGKNCNFEIEQFRVPIDSISKGGIIDNKGWVFVIDKVETSKALQEFIFNNNKNYEPDTSNFDSIIEQYFNDYDIKDDTTHPDYEYVPSINTNGNFENPKNNSSNNSTSNNNNSSNNKVEKPSSQGNNENPSNKPTNGSNSTDNNSTEKPNTSEKPNTPQETPTEQPSENNGSSGNGESSNTPSTDGNASSENSNNQNNTEGN